MEVRHTCADNVHCSTWQARTLYRSSYDDMALRYGRGTGARSSPSTSTNHMSGAMRSETQRCLQSLVYVVQVNREVSETCPETDPERPDRTVAVVAYLEFPNPDPALVVLQMESGRLVLLSCMARIHGRLLGIDRPRIETVRLAGNTEHSPWPSHSPS